MHDKFFVDAPLNKKGTSRRKRKKRICIFCIHSMHSMNSAYSNKSQYRISLETALSFWDQIFPKTVFLVQNRKSSHYNWILHIWLRISSKFQFKQSISSFWTKFSQNWYSKKLYFCMCPWWPRWPTDTTTFQCLLSF